jgi:hypothetical protein
MDDGREMPNIDIAETDHRDKQKANRVVTHTLEIGFAPGD